MVVTSGVKTSGELDIIGLGGLVAGYLVIIVLALFIAFRFRCWRCNHTDLFLAGRRLGYGVGAFTITATWIGGSIIHLTAGQVWDTEDGLLWVHAPIAFAFSLLIGGLFFSHKIRDELGIVTILDPIERNMGKLMAILIAIPMLLSQIMWAATTFSSLSVTLAVLLDVENVASIFMSAFIVYVYTTLGGLYSVIVTDIVQVIFIFFGLWIGFGFAHNNGAVTSLAETAGRVDGWLGTANIPTDVNLLRFFDSAFRYLFAGVTFQIYIQRVLGGRDNHVPRFMSLIGSVLTLFLVIPGVLIGAVARSTRWNETSYTGSLDLFNQQTTDFRFVLPVVLRYLTPYAVGILTLSLSAAASLASVDASIVSSGVLVTNNIYASIRNTFSKKQADSRESLIVTRLVMGIVTFIAMLITLFVKPVYDMWAYTVTLVYVIVFPQLLSVIFFSFANGIGSFCGYVVSVVLLLMSGAEELSYAAVIQYPWYEEDKKRQNFPFKTMLMLLTFFIIIVVSALTHLCYRTGIVPDCCNISGPAEDYEIKKRKNAGNVDPI